MGSKKKAEEDITPGCEEHDNPPKKRKTMSLLLEVESTEKTDAVVSKEEEVQMSANFLLSEHKRFFEDLFEAPFSDLVGIMKTLTRKCSNMPFVKKNDQKQPGCSILPIESNLEEDIEAMELIGAACIFNSDIRIRKYGKNVWKTATKMRNYYGLQKTVVFHSELEEIFLIKQREFESIEDLDYMIRDRQTCWGIQGFLVCNRILKKRGCSLNTFVIENFFKCAFYPSEKRMLPPHQTFAISLYLFEIIGTKDFLEKFVLNPGKTHDVVHTTLAEFFSTLKKKCWDDTLNANPHPLDTFNAFKRTLLSFQNLMTALIFSFAYQVKLHDITSPNEQNTSKAEKVEEVSSLILRILELLMSVPKSDNESTLLENYLATYIHFYERKRANQKPNILLKVCTAHQGKPNEFKLIKLLLKAGADPNAVDQQRCSPLHLLVNSELAYSHTWDNPSYSTRAEYFTSIVRVILDGRFHEDQVNLRGQSALECLQPKLSLYPNAQLCLLVGNFLQQLQGVRPLSCIAAKVVRKHQLPCECLPVTLQSMVLQH